MSAPSITPARLRAFVSAIEKDAGPLGCWRWTGAKNGSGYASGINTPAYRVAYEWLVGPIPTGMQLDHLCRQRDCVNPHHLEPVTKAENLRRARQVGAFQPVAFCRRGHPLVAGNRKVWSAGGGRREVRCYACHDGLRRSA